VTAAADSKEWMEQKVGSEYIQLGYVFWRVYLKRKIKLAGTVPRKNKINEKMVSAGIDVWVVNSSSEKLVKVQFYTFF
jgi:hypothetical protein